MSRRKDKSILTELETLFVKHFEGDGSKAARKAGAKRPADFAWMALKRPRVKEAIAAKQLAMAQESGKRVARAVGLSRTEVMELVGKIGRNGETDAAKVAALNLAAKILGMIITKTEDVTTKYAGWTEEEMEAYAVTGEYPERIRSLLRDGQPGSMPESPAATTTE